jgi:hypothetical protein
MLLICSLIVAFVYGIGLAGWAAEAWATAHKMRYAFLTVASMLALAYVMNLSGQTITIGTWIAATGALFAYLSPTPRVDRHRRHRVGHQRQRPVRHAAAERRGDGRHRPDPARGRQHLRRSRRQDDQPAEPHHRGNRRGSRGP